MQMVWFSHIEFPSPSAFMAIYKSFLNLKDMWECKKKGLANFDTISILCLIQQSLTNDY